MDIAPIHLLPAVVMLIATDCTTAPSSDARAAGEAEACSASVNPQPQELPGLSAGAGFVLRPGETACFVSVPGSGWRAVAQASAQTPHVRAHLSAERGVTFLEVRNATPGRLAYRAAFQTQTETAWRETSIVPVMAGLLNSESWQDRITTLAVFDLRVE